jgi:hypothetical protein
MMVAYPRHGAYAIWGLLLLIIYGAPLTSAFGQASSHTSLGRPDVKPVKAKTGDDASQDPWYENANTLSSVVAVAISILALAVSQRQSKAQSRRERREELRTVIERLVALREELISTAKVMDAQEREASGAFNNVKRSIYLQAAENIAEELGGSVSASEYLVLGVENESDSDFKQARQYYEKAVKASSGLSAWNQSLAWRSLASSYFLQEPFRDLGKGREHFEKAIGSTAGSNDPYTIYTEAFTYRTWAGKEFFAGNWDEGAAKLRKAQESVNRVPDWHTLKFDERRNIAISWKYAAAYYCNSNEGSALEIARSAFQAALDVIDGMEDDSTNDVRGQVLQEWGAQEVRCGFKAEGEALLRRAQQSYGAFSPSYPPGPERMRWFEWLIDKLAVKLD